MTSAARPRIFEYLVLTAILVPLFWLNLNGTHDWGGDFAQYIAQSMDLSGASSNYLYNPDYPQLAPPTYPIGFPLLLKPISSIWGNNMWAYQYFMTALLLGLGLLTYRLLRPHFTWAESGLGVLLFLYNPVTIRFKDEVLSDIPFALFSLTALLLYLRLKRALSEGNRPLLGLWVSLFLAIAVLHRNIGFVFLLAMLLDLGRNHLRTSGLLLGATLGFYLLFDQVLFPAATELNQHFLSLFLSSGFRETLNTTSEYYITIYQDFFTPEGVELDFFPLMTRAFAIAFFFVGLLWRFMDRPGVLEWSTIGYVLVVLLFPNTTQGFRYLLPIFPLVLYYILTGFRAIRLPKPVDPRRAALVALLLAGFPYQNYLKHALRADENHLGPQSTAARQLFRYVRENTPEDAVFAFSKPRVLGLYANRTSMAQHPEKNWSSEFDYLVLAPELPDPASERYVQAHREDLVLVFENARFQVYASDSAALR
ncbi:hypothetical protein HZ996_02875 [Cryomorphaceae bacterium]|nr:hypothetical protein HZ996_02875 [Cryomorphaceae bacterium]